MEWAKNPIVRFGNGKNENSSSESAKNRFGIPKNTNPRI